MSCNALTMCTCCRGLMALQTLFCMSIQDNPDGTRTSARAILSASSRLCLLSGSDGCSMSASRNIRFEKIRLTIFYDCRPTFWTPSPVLSSSWKTVLYGLEIPSLQPAHYLSVRAILSCFRQGKRTSKATGGQTVRRFTQEHQVLVKALTTGTCSRNHCFKVS